MALPYNGDPCGCAYCADAEAKIWNGTEAICAECHDYRTIKRLEAALTALQAENARLRGEVDMFATDAREANTRIFELCARAEKVNSTLAVARAWIAAEAEARGDHDDAYPADHQCAAILARLDQPKGGEGRTGSRFGFPTALLQRLPSS